jgi:predicted amidophosphoribosyltransferase
MKTCPYCAEQIQAAAIVCKHCHRKLVPLRSRPLWRWGRGMLIALGLWFVLALIAFYNSEGQQQFRAFKSQREEWHRKCFPHTKETTPEERDCGDELRALNAVARRRGWPGR